MQVVVVVEALEQVDVYDSHFMSIASPARCEKKLLTVKALGHVLVIVADNVLESGPRRDVLDARALEQLDEARVVAERHRDGKAELWLDQV